MCFKRVSRPRRRLVFKIVGAVMSFIAAGVWLSTIAVLFLRWGLEGFMSIDPIDGQMIFISNIGAAHKAGFILGTVTTAIPYFLSVLFTKLYYDLETRQQFRRVASFLTVISAFVAGVVLFLLSIYDSHDFQAVHFILLGFFIVFILITSALTIIYRFKGNQFNWVLGIHAFLIGAIIPLSITFIITTAIGARTNQENLKSVGGSLEWAIALLLVLYFALYALDILYFPIIKLGRIKREMNKERIFIILK